MTDVIKDALEIAVKTTKHQAAKAALDDYVPMMPAYASINEPLPNAGTDTGYNIPPGGNHP